MSGGELIQRFPAIQRDLHNVVLVQQTVQNPAHPLIVINDQHLALTPRPGIRTFPVHGPDLRFRFSAGGQPEGERGPHAGGALHVDGAPPAGDRAQHRGQPQTGSDLCLGREKGLEDPPAGLLVHSDAGIAHLNLHALPEGPGIDGDGPSPGHGIHGIEQQVDEDIVQSGSGALDGRHVPQAGDHVDDDPPGF